MEKLAIIVAIITIIFVIAILYLNKEIKNLFNNYNVEKFNVDTSDIGLKWVYYTNMEPDGDKINNQKLYDILKQKFVYPVIISRDELDSMELKDLTYDSYIDVEGRYFKPYNLDKIYTEETGRKWIKLGRETEVYVKDNYTEIKNNSINEAIKAKVIAKEFEIVDGGKVYSFTRREYANMIGNTILTHESYIIVDDNIYQPYYPTELILPDIKSLDLNTEYVTSRGLDSSFTGSTCIQTHNMMKTYYSNDAYKTDATNAELSMNTNYMYYRQSGDDMDKTIMDPIEDTYLPYNDVKYNDEPGSVSANKINEYVIIDVYKSLLNRQPKRDELNKNLQEFYEKLGNEEKLKMKIYNSTEYKMIVKMQSNDVEPGLVKHISHIKLIDKIEQLYKQHYKKNIHDKMRVPLKQCYIHLQYNDYLFKAMLMHDKYRDFEKNVMHEYIMTDKILLDIFNEHFVLYELRLIANELKRRDIIKRKAFETPIALHTESSEKAASSIDSKEANMNSGEYISDIVKEGNSVFNINITLNDKNKDESKPYSMTTQMINNDNLNMSEDIYSTKSGESCKSGEISKISSIPEYTEHPKNGMVLNSKTGKMEPYNKIHRDPSYRIGNKIYNPLTYKQQYRGHPDYRPNICSYGTEQVVNPVLLKNSNLLQGTDIKYAFNYTQIGSIMPKFEYREYEEIK